MAQIVSGGRVAWLYQARRVATQANAGGGKIIIDISLATGQVAEVVSCYAINSGTNSLTMNIDDEDHANHSGLLVNIGSGAGTNAAIPSGGGVLGTTTGQPIQSLKYLMGPGQFFVVAQAGAGASGDTLTVAITLLLFNVSTEPTWSKARSTNQADVTLAASTISAANTTQLLLV